MAGTTTPVASDDVALELDSKAWIKFTQGTGGKFSQRRYYTPWMFTSNRQWTGCSIYWFVLQSTHNFPVLARKTFDDKKSALSISELFINWNQPLVPCHKFNIPPTPVRYTLSPIVRDGTAAHPLLPTLARKSDGESPFMTVKPQHELSPQACRKCFRPQNSVLPLASPCPLSSCL